MRRERHIYRAAAVSGRPLGMVVLLVAEVGDATAESLGLFEGVEGEALLQVVLGGVPAFVTTPVDDVINNVFVHILQLFCASLVKGHVLGLQLCEVLIRQWRAVELSGELWLLLEWNEETELSQCVWLAEHSPGC